ncbi:hypothetical protein VTI74DRAFT_7738 [Chaetomium olivicolor]
MSRHHQNQSLETYHAPPGRVTGLYYILVGNLAHSTTWRDLKAFASQACEVDHAAVYPPTSGFVRVRGRANFTKALRHLDGGTLDYRALQADGRNVDSEAVVRLPPSDYHAKKLDENYRGRMYDDPDAPSPDPSASSEQYPQAGSQSPHLGYQGSSSPAYNIASQADAQWPYPASPQYILAEAPHATAVSAAFASPDAMAYQMVPTSAYSYAQEIVTSSPLVPQAAAVYQAIPSPTLPAQSPIQYTYGTTTSYFPTAAGYDMAAAHTYAAYMPQQQQLPRSSSISTGHAYTASYGGDASWATAQPSSPVESQMIPYPATLAATPAPAPTVPDQRRKIIVTDLERDGLDEGAVLALIAQHAGIGRESGDIETVSVPAHRDGRPRGHALITFRTAELAAAAVAAMDGLAAGRGRRRIGVRFTSERADSGCLGSGSGGGGGGGRSGRKSGGGPGCVRSSGGGAKRDDDAGRGRTSPGHSAAASRSTGPMTHQQQHRHGGDISGLGAGLGLMTLGSSSSGSRQQAKEKPPVVVDGSGGRFRRERAPLVVDGSSGKDKKRGNGGNHKC